MFLQYHLTEGPTRNLLIDTVKEKLYFLPKELTSEQAVVARYTDYALDEFEALSLESFCNQWVEFLEVNLNLELLDAVFQFADNCLADYLLFWVSSQEEMEKASTEIAARRDRGELALRQVYLVFDFELDWEAIPEDPSGFMILLKKTDLMRQRTIGLQNFKAIQELVLESQDRNLFFHARLYIDAEGFVKPHFGSSSKRFPLLENLSRHKELVQEEELTEYWTVSKDRIEVCRDCEFRSVCIDADLPVKMPEGGYRRNRPCSYDPYAGKWKDEGKMENLAVQNDGEGL